GLRRHEEERAVDQGERPRDIAREVEEPRAGVERKRARAGVGGELDRALHLGERLAAEPGAVLTARNDEAHAAPGEIHLDAGGVGGGSGGRRPGGSGKTARSPGGGPGPGAPPRARSPAAEHPKAVRPGARRPASVPSTRRATPARPRRARASPRRARNLHV